VLLVLFVFSPAAKSPAAAAGETAGTRAFILALSAGLFAYGGWHMVTYSAEETRDPSRTIPRALMIGTLLVTACYFALNAAYMYVLSPERMVESTRVAADAASALLGPRAAAAVSALVIVSIVGVMNGVILAGPRVYLAMSRDGLLFSWMGAVHPRFHTPHVAVVVQAVWACVLVATGTYRALFTRVVYSEWLFFALMTVGLFRMRRRPDYAPRYRAWGYPLAPLVFVAASVIVVLNQVIADPVESGLGLLLVLIGLPVYYLWARPTQGASVADH
jgi:APA family basic amino acid/polyamine antiporter